MRNDRRYANRTPRVGFHGKDYAIFRVHGPLRTTLVAEIATGHEAKIMLSELAESMMKEEHVAVAFVVVKRSTGKIVDKINMGQVL